MFMENKQKSILEEAIKYHAQKRFAEAIASAREISARAVLP